jgi:hypothetical protein
MVGESHLRSSNFDHTGLWSRGGSPCDLPAPGTRRNPQNFPNFRYFYGYSGVCLYVVVMMRSLLVLVQLRPSFPRTTFAGIKAGCALKIRARSRQGRDTNRDPPSYLKGRLRTHPRMVP